MSIFSLLRRQTGKNETSAASSVSRAAMPLELEAIAYLENLINRKESTADIFKRFAEAKNLPDFERDRVYVKTYYALEDFISKNKPMVVKRTLTKEEIRREIRKNLDISKARPSFRLIFLLDIERSLALFELSISVFVQQILVNLGADRLRKVASSVIKGPILGKVLVTDKGLDFGAIYEGINQVDKAQLPAELKSLYSVLYQEIINSFGKNVAGDLIEKNYSFIRDSYEYEVVAQFLSLLPEGVLERERLAYLTREELEQQAKKVFEEKAKREVAEKAAQEMRNTIEELDKTRKAMLNLLDDAKELEDELKNEKAGVEKKIRERTRELTEEQARLRASISSLPVGFVMTDAKDDIIVMNEVAKSILCFQSRNHSFGVITKENIEHLDCNLQEIESRLKGSFDIKLAIDNVIKDKKPFEIKELAIDDLFLHIFIAPIVTMKKEGFSVIGSVMLVENVTERKIIDRSKDEFFSIASHELRTPLTAIKGNTSMILDYFSEQLKDSQLKEMIDDVHESSIRLIQIVNDFLDVSRLELSKMEFKKDILDLSRLIPDVIKQYQVTGSRKMLYIHFEDAGKTLSVVGDQDRFRQVLINLIGNGLKFTQKGGVTVSLKPENGFVKILVADTGMGISEESQKLLFRKFQQAENNIFTRDTTKGTGLGLYISKLMVEGMGGKIRLENSVVGKGSVFSFTLPAAENANT